MESIPEKAMIVTRTKLSYGPDNKKVDNWRQQDLAMLLHAFYERHDPSMLSSVDKTLSLHKNQPLILMQR
jgi:hypothetical protein